MCMGGAPSTPPPPPPPPPTKLSEKPGGQRAPKTVKSKTRSLRTKPQAAAGTGLKTVSVGNAASPTLGVA